MLIAVLAAALALSEMGEKGAQNAYLTYHIALSDDWAFYQAKNARATAWAVEAGILANLPNAADAGPQAEIKRAKETEARLRDEPGADGMKQLEARAKANTAARDEAFHRYHQTRTGGRRAADCHRAGIGCGGDPHPGAGGRCRRDRCHRRGFRAVHRL